MTITVVLPGYLHPYADGRSRIALRAGGATVRDALDALRVSYPGVSHRVLTEQGEVRPHINVFVGDENIRFTDGLATPLRDGSEVVILPAVSGG